MKIFIICSKHFYEKVMPIKKVLEAQGHRITLPNSFDEPFKEEEVKKQSKKEHIRWKQGMIRLQDTKIQAVDAVLVLNFEKHGQKNYIGGATFLEVFKAWDLGKNIFFYNPLPEGMLHDELTAFDPLVINSDLSLIR